MNFVLSCLGPREGVIIQWPLNGQFHDARGVILTSRTDVREMVDDDDDDEWPLVIYIYICITSQVVKMVLLLGRKTLISYG